MNEIYLVTGAAGHLGNVVVRELIAKGQQVRAFVLPKDEAVEKLPDGTKVCFGDVLDKVSLQRFFDVPEDAEVIVIHCAGIVSTASKYQQNVYDVNVMGTKNVVDMCRAKKIKKMVHISSVHAIPVLPGRQLMTEVDSFDPDKVLGPYAKTKAEATDYVLEAVKRGLDASIIYPCGICGPYDYGRGHMTQLLIDFYQGRLPMGIHGGFDFADVRDIATGVISCCIKGKNGEGYILGNRYVSVREMLGLFHEITGKKRTKIYVPMWLAKASVPFFTLYYKLRRQTPLYSSYSLHTLSVNSNYSHEKAARELGYTVRPFEKTVKDTFEWLKNEGRI